MRRAIEKTCPDCGATFTGATGRAGQRCPACGGGRIEVWCDVMAALGRLDQDELRELRDYLVSSHP